MAFEELKRKQSVMWGSGPYENISNQLAVAHEHLLSAIEPQDGERWLDVATGTGEIACRVAARGAEVTGLDLAPDLIDTAKKRAGAASVEVRFDVGDAEALPYDDASFDTVSSTFGVMFAPDHAAVARELARVAKPGGRLGLATWPPVGSVADLFKVMAPYQPAPPPEGVGNPFDWGDRGHVEELLGNSFEVSFEEGDTPHDARNAEQVWDEFSTAYGPTKALAGSLDDERREALHRDFIEHYRQYETNGSLTWPRPYLLVIGRRR